jgi:hypothetical protein
VLGWTLGDVQKVFRAGAKGCAVLGVGDLGLKGEEIRGRTVPKYMLGPQVPVARGTLS